MFTSDQGGETCNDMYECMKPHPKMLFCTQALVNMLRGYPCLHCQSTPMLNYMFVHRSLVCSYGPGTLLYQCMVVLLCVGMWCRSVYLTLAPYTNRWLNLKVIDSHFDMSC